MIARAPERTMPRAMVRTNPGIQHLLTLMNDLMVLAHVLGPPWPTSVRLGPASAVRPRQGGVLYTTVFLMVHVDSNKIIKI